MGPPLAGVMYDRSSEHKLVMIQLKRPIPIAILLLLVACSWVELPPPRGNPRDVIMDAALAQLDRPYRYHGDNPAGFDASGLVRYVFTRAGLALPHSAEGQHAQGQIIPYRSIRRGDLLFYRTEDLTYPRMHVGIYIGRSRMVHIPDNDRVRIEVIDTPFWQRRLLDAVSYLP